MVFVYKIYHIKITDILCVCGGAVDVRCMCCVCVVYVLCSAVYVYVIFLSHSVRDLSHIALPYKKK